jgi:hypothetical protein
MAAEDFSRLETGFQSHLKDANNKMTGLQDSLKRYPDRSITQAEIDEVVNLIQESNRDISTLKSMKKEVTLKREVAQSIGNAIKFFLKNKKTLEEKVNEIQIALFYDALNELDDNLKNLRTLKRGERVEKVDQDQL